MKKPKKVSRYDWRVSGHKSDVSGKQFDELVVGNWLHIEQVDANCYWFGIYGKDSHDAHTFTVTLDKSGYRKRINFHDGFGSLQK